MSLLLDRDFMEHFKLSKCEAKQQLNSAVDAMYAKMMEELKQWICDREVQQNQDVESGKKKSQIPIKMESIVIKKEVCECVECMNECRIVKRMTKSNKEKPKMSTFCVTQESGNDPEGRVVDQMEDQRNGTDPIGTQMNKTQIDMFHNVAQLINCQSTPFCQQRDKQILEQMRNNNFDDEEEEYDQELLDEVKREIEEEIEIAALNKHCNDGPVRLDGEHIDPRNGIDPTEIQVLNSQLELSHDAQPDNCQPPTPPPEPSNHQPQEKITEQMWNDDEFHDIYEDDPEIFDQAELVIEEENQNCLKCVTGPLEQDNGNKIEGFTNGTDLIGTETNYSQVGSFVEHTGGYQSGQMNGQRHGIGLIGTHVNTNPRHECDQCSKSFTQKFNLNKHKLIHQNVYPYKCDQCCKSFKHNFNLKKHKMIHLNLKPFQCDQCSKCFRQKCNLQKHKLIHQNVKPFQCDQCSKCFNKSGNLKTHKLIHQNDYPFKCDQCSKGFRQKDNFKSHKLAHLNVKPFQCDQCFKQFTQKASLNTHLLKHKDERRFQCDQCVKRFKLKHHLKNHKLTHQNQQNKESLPL